MEGLLALGIIGIIGFGVLLIYGFCCVIDGEYNAWIPVTLGLVGFGLCIGLIFYSAPRFKAAQRARDAAIVNQAAAQAAKPVDPRQSEQAVKGVAWDCTMHSGDVCIQFTMNGSAAKE